MLEIIKSWLWGAPEQRRFADPVLGPLVTELRPKRPPAWCAWRGAAALTDAEPTQLALGGDARAPDPAQLASLHAIVAGLAEVSARAAAALEACAPEHRPRDFRLASIACWDEADLVFEIRYAAAREDGPTPNVETTWPPDHQAPHRIVIGRNYRLVNGALEPLQRPRP